jgi:hypothetical protein
MRTLVRLLFIAGFALLSASLWQRYQLPEPNRLAAGLQQEPEQIQIKEPSHTVTVNGVTYTIQPLFSYELHGLVVSRHDSDSWIDYIHREWNDHINVVDLCVIWGKNASSGAYRGQSFSSGQFVCYWQAPTREAFAAFDPAAISNNHLLTDNPAIAKKLRSVRVGDQIRFRGYLAEYSHNHNGQPFHRGTSIVRTDTGNGACETVYVQDIEIARRGGGPWRALAWVAWALLGIGCIAWFRMPLANH